MQRLGISLFFPWENTVKVLLLLLILPSCYGQTNEKITSLVHKGDSLGRARQNEQALLLFYEAEKLAEKTADSLTLNTIYYQIGTQHSKLGNNDNAITYFKKSESLSKAIQNDSCYSLALHGQGLANAKKLNFDRAISLYEQALRVQEQNVRNERTEAVILNGLAGVYIAKNDISNTLSFAKKALEKSLTTSDFDLQANILNTISICLEEKEDYKEALRYKKQSLAVCKENQLNIPLVLLANIGNNYAFLKQTDSAFAYYKLAKEKAIATGSDYGEARINYRIGLLHSEQKNYTSSLPLLKKSYSYFKGTQNEEMLHLISKNVSEVYEAIENPSEALAYIQEHRLWQDSLRAQSTHKKMEEFQIKYEALEKEAAILSLSKERELKEILLTQEKHQQKILRYVFFVILLLFALALWYWRSLQMNRLIAVQESKRYKSVIETEQGERKRIAQNLHDTIGQSIAELKTHASSLACCAKDEKQKRQKLLDQVDHVYDELLNISHNVMPNTLIKLGLVPAVQELITEISTNSDLKIILKNDDGFKGLNEEQTIHLYRIIQEALVNIIKYAKASLVHINLLIENGAPAVYVIDDGVGMESALVKNLNGIGWKNIYSRVALLMGKINVTSKPNRGTHIAIHLKAL